MIEFIGFSAAIVLAIALIALAGILGKAASYFSSHKDKN